MRKSKLLIIGSTNIFRRKRNLSIWIKWGIISLTMIRIRNSREILWIKILEIRIGMPRGNVFRMKLWVSILNSDSCSWNFYHLLSLSKENGDNIDYTSRFSEIWPNPTTRYPCIVLSNPIANNSTSVWTLDLLKNQGKKMQWRDREYHRRRRNKLDKRRWKRRSRVK